jgi:hypothetical protein
VVTKLHEQLRPPTVFALVSLRPAAYARSASACAGVIVGLAVAAWLLHTTHHSLLGN